MLIGLSWLDKCEHLIDLLQGGAGGVLVGIEVRSPSRWMRRRIMSG
jgi:hypothetical protein